MTPQACTPETSILESELGLVAEQGYLKEIQIVETTEGYYVTASVKARPAGTEYITRRRKPNQPRTFIEPKGRPSAKLYLATRRELTQVRLFRDLDRLHLLLRSIYPEGTIKLQREGVSPLKARATRTPKRKPVRKK